MSFALVAGACCVLSFSNAVWSGSTPTSVTLNINSTGAKSFTTIRQSSGSGNYGYRNTTFASEPPMVIYNGSKWIGILVYEYGDTD